MKDAVRFPIVVTLFLIGPLLWFGGPSQESHASTEDLDFIILANRIETLGSLRDIFSDERIVQQLGDAIECLPIWGIGSTVDESGDVIHHFNFAVPARHTRRVLVFRYRTRWSESDEAFTVQEVSRFYASDHGLGAIPTPWIHDREAFTAFVDTFLHPAFHSSLLASIEERPQDHLVEATIVPGAVYDPALPDADAAYVVGLHWGGYRGYPHTRSEHWLSQESLNGGERTVEKLSD